MSKKKVFWPHCSKGCIMSALIHAKICLSRGSLQFFKLQYRDVWQITSLIWPFYNTAFEIPCVLHVALQKGLFWNPLCIACCITQGPVLKSLVYCMLHYTRNCFEIPCVLHVALHKGLCLKSLVYCMLHYTRDCVSNVYWPSM